MAENKNAAARPSTKAEWLILSSVESEERRKITLGSVVPKVLQHWPTDDYSPHWADPDLNVKIADGGKQVTKKKVLQDTMERLWKARLDYWEDSPRGEAVSEGEDTAVELNDILTGRIAAKTKGMRTAVADLFNFFLRKHECEEVVIESGSVRRHKIDNPGAKVGDNLMTCGPWKEQLQKLFDRTSQQKSGFLLVTGVLLCQNLTVRWKRNTSSTIHAETKLDGNAVLAAAHQPPNPELAKHLNTYFKFDQEKSTKENVIATCKNSVIFAVRYNWLELKFKKDPGAKDPNFLVKFLSRPAKAGTIESAKMGSVILGQGIMSYATAVENENRADGHETADEGENDDAADWFYGRPPPEENGSGDQNEIATRAAVHQNGGAGP